MQSELCQIIVFLIQSVNYYYFFVFCIFRATPMAYGGFQARGLIGATAAGLRHSSRQRWIFNPLSEARDRIRNLMVPSQICFHCTTTGTLRPQISDGLFDQWHLNFLGSGT